MVGESKNKVVKSTKKDRKQHAPTSHPMERLLQKRATASIRRGYEIDAKIVSLSKKGITFDVGAKAYAVLGDLELKEISTYLPYLKVGDIIRARIISEESREGYPVLSTRKFFDRGKWDILKEEKDKEEEIEVVCGEWGKGGVFVDFMGIRGVIPKIQLTEEYFEHPEKLENHKIKVRVLEVDQAKNRLVVSQKAAVLGISQKERQATFDKIKVGGRYKARVLGTSEFGIFCEVEGIEGLIHISEISWEKVTDISNLVKPGSDIDVIVAEKNKEDLKLNLSIKRLSHDPWKGIEKRYPKSKEVEGDIIRREKYGYFVRLEPGVEGLIHISKLKGDENFKTGQKIKAYIERIHEPTRKLSLILPELEKPVTYR